MFIYTSTESASKHILVRTNTEHVFNTHITKDNFESTVTDLKQCDIIIFKIREQRPLAYIKLSLIPLFLHANIKLFLIS